MFTILDHLLCQGRVVYRGACQIHPDNTNSTVFYHPNHVSTRCVLLLTFCFRDVGCEARACSFNHSFTWYLSVYHIQYQFITIQKNIFQLPAILCFSKSNRKIMNCNTKQANVKPKAKPIAFPGELAQSKILYTNLFVAK